MSDLSILFVLRLKLSEDTTELWELVDHAECFSRLRKLCRIPKDILKPLSPGFDELVDRDPFVQMPLTPLVVDIQNVRGLNAVANWKGDLLEDVSANGILAGEWLDKGG